MIVNSKILAFVLFLFLFVSCDVMINPDVCLVISEDSLDFDYVPVFASTSQEITITNTGTKECLISSMKIKIYDSGTTRSDFTIIEGEINDPITFEQNDERIIKIQFQPVCKGTKTANLEIEYIVNDEKFILPVSLTGIGYNSNIIIQPALITYDKTYVGEKRTDIVTISNCGLMPVTINSVTIVNSNLNTVPGEYLIIGGWNGNDIVLNPNNSIDVSVQFCPSSLGNKHAKVVINIEDSSTDYVCGLIGQCVKSLGITTNAMLPDGVHGQAYTTTFQFEGGDGNYTLSVTNKDLPKGLQLVDYTIRGTPEVHGTFMFSLTLKDTSGHSVTKMFTLFIAYAKLIRDPSDIDPYYIFDKNNNTGTYTINLISEGDIPLTINSISLSGDGVTSGEATIQSQPALPLLMNPNSNTQIVIKVVSLVDSGRNIVLSVNHTGYNSPFMEEFEWRVDKKYIFFVDRSGSMSSSFNGGFPVYDMNGNIVPYPNRFQGVQSMVAERIKALKSNCKFDIVATNSSPYPCFSSLTNATTQIKKQAIEWLYNISPGGGSEFYSAFNTAFNSYGAVDEIQFFSDGCAGDANRILNDIRNWVNTQISYNSYFYFEINQLGGSPMTFMLQLGALPNSSFYLH